MIMFCAELDGAERLFPPEKLKEIENVLDMIYSANAGQLSFRAMASVNPLFRFVLNNFLLPSREKKIQAYLSDPSVRCSPYLRKVYEEALKPRRVPDLHELSERANVVMSLFDEMLKDGQWLLGQEHTAADCVAAIWVQWIVWADTPLVAVTPRVIFYNC